MNTCSHAVLSLHWHLLLIQPILVPHAVHEEQPCDQAERELGVEHGLDAGVVLEELDDDGLPAARGGEVEEGEDQHLEDEDDEEDAVGELEHPTL